MGNTEKVDTFNKFSSDKVIGAKHFSNKKPEKQHADCVARNYNGKAERNYSRKNGKAVQKGTEGGEIFTLTEYKNTKAVEANTTEKYSEDCDQSEWQQVKPKRGKSQRSVFMPIYIKTNENLRQNRRQERLNSSERRTAHFKESNSQQSKLSNASGLKAKSVTLSTNKYSNGMAVIYKNKENDSQNVYQIAHDKLNKCDKKHTMDRNETLNVSVTKTLNSRETVKVEKQENKSGNLSTETPVKHLAVNPNCHFKNTGAIPKRSQTFEQVEAKTFGSEGLEPEGQNQYNETKECKLKQMKINKVSEFERSNLVNQTAPHKLCETSLNKAIDQTQLNECLETDLTNVKHKDQIDESITKEGIHQKANLNIEKLDRSSDLTEENETIRNVERLDDTNNANGVYQHNAQTSHLTNEDETVEGNLENSETITGATDEYQYRASFSFLNLPYWAKSILPFQQNTANCIFQPQFEDYLASEIPAQSFDNGVALDDLYLNGFPNATCYQSEESTVNEQNSENVTNPSQNTFNGFTFSNFELNCVWYGPSIVEHTYNGSTYYEQVLLQRTMYLFYR